MTEFKTGNTVFYKNKPYYYVGELFRDKKGMAVLQNSNSWLSTLCIVPLRKLKSIQTEPSVTLKRRYRVNPDVLITFFIDRFNKKIICHVHNTQQNTKLQGVAKCNSKDVFYQTFGMVLSLARALEDNSTVKFLLSFNNPVIATGFCTDYLKTFLAGEI